MMHTFSCEFHFPLLRKFVSFTWENGIKAAIKSLAVCLYPKEANICTSKSFRSVYRNVSQNVYEH